MFLLTADLKKRRSFEEIDQQLEWSALRFSRQLIFTAGGTRTALFCKTSRRGLDARSTTAFAFPAFAFPAYAHGVVRVDGLGVERLHGTAVSGAGGADRWGRLTILSAARLPNATGVLPHHGLPLLATKGFLKLRHIGYHSVRSRLRR